jgi:hypothetical protein
VLVLLPCNPHQVLQLVKRHRQQVARLLLEVQRRPPRPQPDADLRTPLGLQHGRGHPAPEHGTA